MTAKIVGLSWVTEIKSVGTEVRDLIEKHTGGGEPGWNFECTSGGLIVRDEFTGMTDTALESVAGGVDAIFDAKSAAMNTSLGGLGAGLVLGTDLYENR
jgi:hypothetical protein